MNEKKDRLMYIDNIRVFVIVLVILMHLAVTYSGFGSWYYNEGAEIGVAEMILFGFFQSFLQAFFMGLLFLISGYFVPAAYDRKGFGKFLKDRLIRLVIPGVVYMVIINPLMSYYLADFLGEELPGFLNYYGQYMTSVWVLEGSGPMWFVLTLFLFNLAYALVLLVRKNLLRPLTIMPIFKFLLTALICVPLCFAIGYFVLIRIPGLKKIL